MDAPLSGLARRFAAMSVASILAVTGLTLAGSPTRGAQPSPTPFEYVGHVDLAPSHAVAGSAVMLTGSGFVPGAVLSIVWNTVKGHWVLQGAADEEFHGRAFDPVAIPMTTATVAVDGTLGVSFTAPVDYGFSHDVTVEQDGRLLNKAGFRLDPTVTIDPASGPVGTPVTIRMEGVGWATLENSWDLTYDDRFVGLLSSVTSGGVAVAVIPATGAQGKHHLRVVHGAMTVPYLNGQQSPRPDRPVFDFDFEITAGDPVLPPQGEAQGLAIVASTAPTGDGPALWPDVASGPVGTPVTLHGRGFPANADVALDWYTVIGNRVGGQGWDEASKEVGHLAAGSDGTFEFAWQVPDDLGGVHRLEATIGDTTLAQASLTITPSIISATTAHGPYGSDIVLHLKGVGWTETANIYHVVYDDGFLGYACGFNSQGDVTIHLPATGVEGWHFIDLYPGIYKGEDAAGVQDFRIPQLTFAEDHPGERLPAFHVAYELTGG